MQGQITSATCSIAQRAAITALSEDPSTQSMCQTFKQRRDLIIKLLSEIKWFKKLINLKGLLYFFPNISYYLGKKYQKKSY